MKTDVNAPVSGNDNCMPRLRIASCRQRVAGNAVLGIGGRP